jgi:diaminopimelate epimerase
MTLTFQKYHGNGNDFIMIDNRENVLRGDEYILFAKLCTRRFGVGADGVILVQDHKDYDFDMKYYNADGKPGSMCGNGGRCAIKFAASLEMIDLNTVFMAVDGIHQGKILPQRQVSLKMNDVTKLFKGDGDYVIDTGSPHYIKFVKQLDELDVYAAGKKIRYSEPFTREGINVNFVEMTDAGIKVRTYERGVEDETFSCGTGVTAAALATSVELELDEGNIEFAIKSLGGELKVSFEKTGPDSFSNIWLTGGAQYVYTGRLETAQM